MFDYLTDAEIDELNELLTLCKDEKEINVSLEYLTKLQVPANSLKALIFYKLKLEPSDETRATVERLKELELSSKFATNPENEKDIYRELFITLGNSIDVIVLKLAIELGFLSANKAQRCDVNVQAVAKLSQDIYAPLCHRLGLGEMKVEFEDLSLYVLENEQYFKIAEKLKLKKNEREKLIEEMIEDISKQISQDVETFRIFGRSKHI